MHGTLALSDGGVGMSPVTCDDVGAALAVSADVEVYTGRPTASFEAFMTAAR